MRSACFQGTALSSVQRLLQAHTRLCKLQLLPQVVSRVILWMSWQVLGAAGRRWQGKERTSSDSDKENR